MECAPKALLQAIAQLRAFRSPPTPPSANSDDALTGYPAEIKHAPDYLQLSTSELTHTIRKGLPPRSSAFGLACVRKTQFMGHCSKNLIFQ
jgi:hypothetical protein